MLGVDAHAFSIPIMAFAHLIELENFVGGLSSVPADLYQLWLPTYVSGKAIGSLSSTEALYGLDPRERNESKRAHENCLSGLYSGRVVLSDG